MVIFYIVRHGQTILNSLNRAQGWTDSPLTELGVKSAFDLGVKLKDIKFNAAYSSDTIRAQQTAGLIINANEKPNISVQIDKRLREWCLGSLEAESNPVFIERISNWLGTKSFMELNMRLPDVANAILQHDKTKMAEEFSSITYRLKTFFNEIAERFSKEKECNILVVTHAFAIKTLYYLFAPEKLNISDKVNNASIMLLKFDNDTNCFIGMENKI